MNRTFLTLIAAICGLAVLVSIIVLPMMVDKRGDKSDWIQAVQTGSGTFMLLFAVLATGFCGLVLIKKTDLMGLTEERHLSFSMIFFVLTFVFGVAQFLAGTGHVDSWGIGFFLTLLTSLAGSLATVLATNPAMAKKLAAAASTDAPPPPEAPPPAEEAPADDS